MACCDPRLTGFHDQAEGARGARARGCPRRVLEWWAANEINFPALSVMARQYLGVPATSASAERLFSITGRAYDDLRQAMREDMLEMLMWARINREKRQSLRASS